MVYMFDIDGTLTAPRQKMTEEFEKFFIDWMNCKSVFLVTGSDMSKVKEQVSENVLRKCAGIFTSMANEYYYLGNLKYKNEIKIPETLIGWLQQQLEFSAWTKKTSNHFEYRPGMLNFSIIGRDATVEQRNQYYEWDKQVLERVRIANYINAKYPDLEACIGGQISIDIQGRGKNKSQAVRWIFDNYSEQVYYFGDKCNLGGNDHAACLEIDNKPGSGYYKNVEGPEELMTFLMELEE